MPGESGEVKNLIIRIAFFADCSSDFGIWSYTLKTANMLALDSCYYKILISNPPRNKNEEERLVAASPLFDQVIFIRRPISETDSSLAKDMALLINTNNIHIYIPNYRDFPFVALHWVNKKIITIGICHNNHDSYYNKIKRYISLLDGVICPNSEAANVLSSSLKKFSNKMIYIPHYVNRINFSKEIKLNNTGVLKLIYFGRVVIEQKEVLELIKIALLLKSKKQNFVLKVIGNGVDKEKFIHEINKNNLGDVIKTYASMNQDELIPHLMESHFSIICSKYEGFCYSAAESMAAGVPVACYKNNAMCDYIRNMESGIMVGWGEANLLVDNIIDVFNKAELYNSIKETGTKVIESKFSKEMVFIQYDSLFKKYYSHNTNKYWPKLRPKIEPKNTQILRRVLEYSGKKLGIWF